MTRSNPPDLTKAMPTLRHAVLAVVALSCSHTMTVSRLTNLAATPCQESLRDAFGAILVARGEKEEVADLLSTIAASDLAKKDVGLHPFLVSSPSGIDYAFFVEGEGKRCVVRLFGEQKGFVAYKNNLTYIATRSLPGCTCATT